MYSSTITWLFLHKITNVLLIYFCVVLIDRLVSLYSIHISQVNGSGTLLFSAKCGSGGSNIGVIVAIEVMSKQPGYILINISGVAVSMVMKMCKY